MSLDLQAVGVIQQRIEIIELAIKRADKFLNKDAYLDLDGKRELKTMAELTKMRDAEEAKLRAMAA